MTARQLLHGRTNVAKRSIVGICTMLDNLIKCADPQYYAWTAEDVADMTAARDALIRLIDRWRSRPGRRSKHADQLDRLRPGHTP